MLTARLQGVSDHLESMTKRLLTETQVDLYFNRFPKYEGKREARHVYLGVSPVISVDLVEYEQLNTGTLIPLVLNTGYYQSLYGDNPYISEVLTSGSTNGFWPDYDLNWFKPNVFHIGMTCGVADQTTIPAQIIYAGYMLLTMWYQNREGSNPNIEYKDLPGYASIVGMLAPYTRLAL